MRATREEAHQFITKARALVEDPAHWIQEGYAGRRTAAGDVAYTTIADGNCFCMLGTLQRVAQDMHKAQNSDDHGSAKYSRQYERIEIARIDVDMLLKDYIQEKHHLRVYQFNDYPGRQHAEVLAVYDELLEMLK